MKKALGVWLCLFWVCAANGGSKSDLNTAMRVLLDRGARYGAVKSTGSHLYLGLGTGEWRKLPSLAKIHIERPNGKPHLTINNERLKARFFYLRGGTLQGDRFEFQGKKYRGALRVTLRNDSLVFTNVLPLETYLEGMLASEMSPSWEMEALKAQAIAARSYALYMKKHPKDALYDLESGTQDQVYGGADAEHPRVRVAVRDTAGVYLSTKTEPLKAYFHSRCGGMTATAREVWDYPRVTHRTRADCPYCRKHKAVWRAAVGVDEFFGALGMDADVKSPFRILPTVSPSGRLNQLRIEAGKFRRTVSADELRALLGYNRLKSARFDWTHGNDHIHFEGVGAGHGVGMCQWGARGLAKEGRNHREIVAHYFPDAHLIIPIPLTAQN